MKNNIRKTTRTATIEPSLRNNQEATSSESKISRLIKFVRNLLSDNNLTKKAYLNAIASALDYGARLVVGFLITPYLVSGLGDFFYGLWQLMIRVVGYITPASGRPTQALKMTLANKQNSTDFQEKRRFVGSTIAVFLLFLPVTILLGGLLAWFVPYWIHVSRDIFWIVRALAGLLVLNLILANLAAIPQAILQGENMGYKRMGLSAMLVILGGILTWTVLYLKMGILGIATATIINTLITGLFFLQVMRSYAPWFGVIRPSLDDTKKFLGLSWWFLGWNVITSLMTASDVFILGVFKSVEAVTSYTLTKYAPETLITIIAIIVFGIAPGLGGIIGSGDYEKAAKLRGEIMVLTWIIMTTIGSSIILWNRTFISLWVGEKQYAGAIPTLLVVLVAAQFVLIRNDSNVIDLTLNIRDKVLWGGLSVAISLIASSALIYYFDMGIVGLCLGLIAGRIVLSIVYPIMVGRLLKIPFSSQLKGIIRPVTVSTIIFGFTSILSEWLVTNTWIGLRGWLLFALWAAFAFLVMLVLIFYAGLSGVQREQVLRRVRIGLSVVNNN